MIPQLSLYVMQKHSVKLPKKCREKGFTQLHTHTQKKTGILKSIYSHELAMFKKHLFCHGAL